MQVLDPAPDPSNGLVVGEASWFDSATEPEVALEQVHDAALRSLLPGQEYFIFEREASPGKALWLAFPGLPGLRYVGCYQKGQPGG